MFYECEDLKAGRVNCTDCFNLIEPDKCIEESRLMTLYKLFHPDRKPARFVPKIRNTDLVLVERGKIQIMKAENKSYPLMKV